MSSFKQRNTLDRIQKGKKKKKEIRPVAYVDIYAHGRETMERFNEEILTFKPAEEKRLLKIESLQPSDRDDLQQ